MIREAVELKVRSILELEGEELTGMTLDDFCIIHEELPSIIKELEAAFNVDVSELTLDVEIDDIINTLWGGH